MKKLIRIIFIFILDFLFQGLRGRLFNTSQWPKKLDNKGIAKQNREFLLKKKGPLL